MQENDRRRKLAHDGIDPDDDGGEKMPASAAMKLQEFAKGKMGDEDFSDFLKLLENLSGVGLSTDEILGPEETEEERQERLAKRRQERLDGGEYGLDGHRRLDVRKAEAEFKSMFPSAGAVANGFDVASQDARLIHTAKAEAEFRKLCPDAKPLVRA
jgi:hypothetical protein